MPDLTQRSLMAERVGIRSRAYALPLRGPAPSFESHRLSWQWLFDSHAFPILHGTFDGGEGGIRTHGPVAETHAFQACRFVHSRTSPRSDDFKGWHLITQVGGRQGKGTASRRSDSIRNRPGNRGLDAASARNEGRWAADSPPLTPFARIPILRNHFSGGA